MSQLFDELFHQAMQRDYRVAAYAGTLMNAMQCGPLEAKRHALRLNEMHDEFHDGLMLVARRNRMRVRDWQGTIAHGSLLVIAVNGALPQLADLPEEET